MKKLFNYLKTIKHIKLYSIIAGILCIAIIVGSILVITNSNDNTQGVFTVTFANPDGSVIKTLEKEYNESLTEDEFPDESEVSVNAGMKFVGWDTSYIEHIIEDVVITALQKSIIATQGSVEDENLNEFVYEAEDAINTASTGKEVQISETESRTVKSLYFKQDKAGTECTVTSQYAIQSSKDVELKFIMVMGHRSGGTHKISDLMTIELSHNNGSTYSKYPCNTSFTNTHWLQAEGGIGEKYGDMVTVNVGSMKLKKGINRILITGTHSLYLNLDCIKFQGDISGLSISTAKAAVRIDDSSGADSKNTFTIQAENAKNTASTGKEVQISETEKGAVKSLYFKQDKAGTECVITNEYAIASTKDVSLVLKMKLGHRKGGTNKFSDMMTIEISNNNGASYTKYNTNATITNTHWMPEFGKGDKYGDMSIATLGTISLKKGINRIRITGIKGLYVNVDWIRFEGDVSGLSISNEKPASESGNSANVFTFEAENAVNTASTGKAVQISETDSKTVKSLYFKQDIAGTECTITNEYAIASTKDVQLTFLMKLGNRKGGTNKISDQFTIEISNNNGASYTKYNTDATVTNVHWMPEFGTGDKYGDMSIATLGTISLKKGINRIRITGIKGLYVNVDWIRFEGDVSGLSVSNEKPASESGGSDTDKAFTYEAEDAVNTASTGKEVQISETDSKTVKSLYFKQDKAGTECVITNEYAIASTKDVQLTFLMKLGNRKGGTNKISDQFTIEISYDNGATYTKYNTDATVTNVHWMPEFGTGDKYGDMSIATLGTISLKKGINRIRITGIKGLYVNLDWIRFEGDISGLSISNEKPVAKMYTIRFNNPDGTLIKSIQKEENASLTSSEYPLDTEVSLGEGKEFDGWDIAPISKITKDVVITAKQKDIDKTKITLQAENAKYSSNTGTNVIISDTESLTVKSVYMNNGQVTIDYKIVITGNTNQEYGLLIRMGHRSGGLRKLSDMLTFELKTSGALDYSKFDSTGYIYNVAWTEKWGDMDDADVAIITLKPGENHLRIVGNLALYANIDSITLFGDATKIAEEEAVEKSYKFEAENAKHSGTNVSTIISNHGSKGKSVYMNNGVVTIDYTIYLTEDATFKWDITLGHRNSGTHNLSDMLTFKVKTASDTEYSLLTTNSSVSNTWNFSSGDNETMMGTANVGTISLKAGENHLCIVGTNSLPVNIDYITLIGDTEKIQQKIKIEAEQAKCVAGSSATPTISTCGSGAASVYMYGDTKGVVYVDFTINATSDVEVDMNAVLGHRDSGTHKLSDMFYIDVKDATSQEYKSVTTNGEVTNNWVWQNGDTEVMMGTANVGAISLKAGENHIRIKAKSNFIRANLDYIILLGEVSGLTFVPNSQN